MTGNKDIDKSFDKTLDTNGVDPHQDFSVEQFFFDNNIVQMALIQLLVEKGIISPGELAEKVAKIQGDMH
jgi:hypothetical protein